MPIKYFLIFWCCLTFSAAGLAQSDMDFLKSQSYKTDQPLFVFYFASWCGFCEKAAPSVQATYEKVKSCSLQFVGISGDDKAEPIEKVKSQWGLRFPIVHDKDRTWFNHLNIKQIPRVVFFDEKNVRQLDGHGSLITAQALAKIEDWAKQKKCLKSH